MALTPHNDDKNRDKVKADITKLEKKDTAQAADELKQKHNIGEKQNITAPNSKIVTK